MAQEEIQLLLKDLCARLPYGVKCAAVTTNNEPNTIGGYCEVLDSFYIREVDGWFGISMIKPYLRPMSSMTKEEKASVIAICLQYAADDDVEGMVSKFSDFYNRRHLDYHGLIEKGLALEAPEGMYKTE